MNAVKNIKRANAVNAALVLIFFRKINFI